MRRLSCCQYLLFLCLPVTAFAAGLVLASCATTSAFDLEVLGAVKTAREAAQEARAEQLCPKEWYAALEKAKQFAAAYSALSQAGATVKSQELVDLFEVARRCADSKRTPASPILAGQAPGTPAIERAAGTPFQPPAKADAFVQKRVAVLDLRNEADLPPRDLDYLTEVVRTGARKALPTDRFILMTKENIYDLLPPEKRNLAQCEGQCEVETGRMINADYLVTGAVTQFAGELRVTIRLYEVAKGNLLQSMKASGKKTLDLEAPIETLVEGLFGTLGGNQASVPLTGRTVLPRGTRKNEHAMFTSALDSFERGDLELAASQFAEFSAAFPESSSNHWALYYRASALFKLRQWKDAILGFDEFAARFPDDKRAASAYLFMAAAFQEMGQMADARLFYEKVVRQFPKSQEAEVAAKRLKALR